LPDKALAELEDSITHLKFVPESTAKKKLTPAHFIGKINNGEKEIELDPRWVYDNFHEEHLITTMTDGVERGFVEVADTTIQKDKDQVSHLKCIAFDRHGEELAKKEWYCKQVGNRTPRKVGFKWVKQNFPKKFIDELKRKSERPGFIVVPPGRPRAKKDSLEGKLDIAPTVKYLQGDKKHCVHYSFASVLHFLNFKKVADIVKQDALRTSEFTKGITSIISIMKKQLGWLEPVRFEKGELNPLENRSKYPTLMILMGDDGSVHHGVTTVGDWLFDSNRDFAEKISTEMLDWCVSNDEEKQKCIGVFVAYRFIERKTDSAKKKRNRYQFEYES